MDQYFNECQTEAFRISALIEGMSILHNEGSREATNAAYVVLGLLGPMASKLADDLDSVNLAKVQS